MIPYIDQINFEYRTVEDRRKLPGLIALLEAVTVLFAESCPKDNENGIIFSLPFVYDIVAVIARDIISVSRGDLNRGERRVWNFIIAHFSEIRSVMRDGKPPRNNQEPEAFMVSDLCPGRPEFSDVHSNTVRGWLNGLAGKGYLQRVGNGRGRQACYLPVYKNITVNSNGENKRLIPELGPVSATDYENNVLHVYEGLPTVPELTPPIHSIHPIGNCKLVNLRIKPEMLEFEPDWLKTRRFSSQTKFCDPKAEAPPSGTQQTRAQEEWVQPDWS